MRENRLTHKIKGGYPHGIRDANKHMEVMQKEQPETAAAAMAHAVPQVYKDRMIEHIKQRAHGGGIPSKYKQEFAVEAYQLLADPKRCWTLKSLAALFGVYEKTFYDWLKVHDDLAFAVYTGRAIQENNFGSMLLHGFKYSSGVEFILTNLHDWTLKQKTEHTLDLNAAIAAQERAKKEQGIVWDEESAQKPAPLLLRESKDEKPAVREDDSDYKGGNNAGA